MKSVLTKLVLVLLLSVLGCVVQARGATLTVTSASDTTVGAAGCDDGCSLREAVTATAAGDTIQFSSLFNSPQTILLGSSLVPPRSMTINGPGAHLLTLRVPIFALNSAAATVVISGITFTGGFNLMGGAILLLNGTLTLNGCVVTGSTADQGGGIRSQGSLNLNNCTISNNTAEVDGGGIQLVGGTTTITNSTISGNRSNGDANTGGGISLLAPAALTITNSTITNNSAPDNTVDSNAGGLRKGGSTSSLTFRNTVIAGNVDYNNVSNVIPDMIGAGSNLTSNGYNFVGNNALGPAPQPTDRFGFMGPDGIGTTLDPDLGVLGTYGGTLPVHAPNFGSPLIDKGNAFGSATDQHGEPRVADFLAIANAAGGDGSDNGAYEVQAVPTSAPVSVAGRVLTDGGRGLVNAAVVLTDMRGVSRTVTTSSFGYFRFDDLTAGETVVVSVSSKRYPYAPQVVTVNENIVGLNFSVWGK